MTTGNSQPVFSRRSFIAFLMLAPAGILCVFAIIVVLQFRQFKAMVSSTPELLEFSWTAENEAVRDSLISVLNSFSTRSGGDTLRLDPSSLTVLLSASPAAREQQLRFSVEVRDSLFVLRSTQPIEALQGRVSWIFRKLGRSGFLNSRVEGHPKFEKGILELEPERGFLNDQKIPRAALVKRGGMSPGDFLSKREEYEEFVRALSGVTLGQGGVLLIRK